MARRARRRIMAGIAREGRGVKHPWAIYIAKEDCATLAILRLRNGIEVAENGDEIWLRGKAGEESLDTKIAALPARERFEWLNFDKLRRIDQRVPSRRLPELAWKPINTWSEVRFPLAAFPADLPAKVELRLVRSFEEQQPTLLLTSVGEFSTFSAVAAAIRLNPLRFAANANGEVLIRGNPLPPLPGRRFVLHGRIAVPTGFAWRPAVAVEVLERAFNVSGDAMVLWHEDGPITRLHTEQFIAVTRSAVRATADSLKNSL
jgi:hypothetical protein